VLKLVCQLKVGPNYMSFWTAGSRTKSGMEKIAKKELQSLILFSNRMNIKWIMADGTCTIWFGHGLLADLCEYNNVWLKPLKSWKFLYHTCKCHLLLCGICQTRNPKIVHLALDVFRNLNLLCCKLRCVSHQLGFL